MRSIDSHLELEEYGPVEGQEEEGQEAHRNDKNRENQTQSGPGQFRSQWVGAPIGVPGQ
ncbi:MAG: hypothetical protein ACJAY5_000648 [Actinomycetes bacterium]